jgi:hypothetical protein
MSNSSLMELIAQKRNAIAAGNRAKTIKPKDGRNRFRILPRWDGDATKPFWHDFGSHFIKDIAGNFLAAYICTDKTFGMPCEVCVGIKQAMSGTRDDGMVKLLKDANAAARVLVNVLWIDSDKPNEPQILELAPSAFSGILSVLQEWGGDTMNATNGRDIIIERQGTGLNTKYTVAPCAQTSSFDPAIISKAMNLDDYVKQESLELQTKALNGLRSVVGLLPAPGSTPALGSTTLSSVTPIATNSGVDLYAAAPATASPAVVAATSGIAADPYATAATIAAAPVVTQTVTAPEPTGSSTGDAELDSLLASLPS